MNCDSYCVYKLMGVDADYFLRGIIQTISSTFNVFELIIIIIITAILIILITAIFLFL